MATITDLGTSAQTNTATPSLTSITVAAGDILVVAVHTQFSEPAPLVTACTFNGEALTQAAVAGPVGSSGAASWGSVALLYLVPAGGATADVLVTLEYGPTNTSSWITAWKVETGNTSSPLGDTDTSTSTTTSSTLTLTTAAGDVVITAAIAPDGWTDLTLSPQSGTTADYQNDPAGSGAIIEVGAGHRDAVGSSTAVGWDLTYSKPLMHAAIVIQTAAGGGGDTMPPWWFTRSDGGMQNLTGGMTG